MSSTLKELQAETRRARGSAIALEARLRRGNLTDAEHATAVEAALELKATVELLAHKLRALEVRSGLDDA